MNYQKKAIEIMDNVSKVIVGKEDVTKLVLTSLIAGGHVLLEDVPGTGKTMLAKTVAKSVDAQFSRIQFTPDLLPSDVTGINYYNQKAGEFVFRRGPVFSNILLADEINRATPRTQSALLECMEEHQVTVDSDTYRLEEPFLVIATQNPIETAGTYQLPEAQLVQGFGVEEYFFQCQIGGDGYPASEVRQVAVACQQVLLHEVERMSVCGGGRGNDVPLNGPAHRAAVLLARAVAAAPALPAFGNWKRQVAGSIRSRGSMCDRSCT